MEPQLIKISKNAKTERLNQHKNKIFSPSSALSEIFRSPRGIPPHTHIPILRVPITTQKHHQSES